MTDFDPYYTWLGIPPEEQPADHYRLLGVRRLESNEEVILNASDQRMGYVRTFQVGKRSKESQQLLNELSAAQAVLLNPAKKKAYDDGLRAADAKKNVAVVAAPPQPAPLPKARALHDTEPVIAPAYRTPAAPLRQMTPPLARQFVAPPKPAPPPPQAVPAPRPAPSLPQQAARPATPALADPLAGSSLRTLRPVVQPKSSGLPLPLPVLIAGGALAIGVLTLVSVSIWALTRSSPEVAKLPKPPVTIPQPPITPLPPVGPPKPPAIVPPQTPPRVEPPRVNPPAVTPPKPPVTPMPPSVVPVTPPAVTPNPPPAVSPPETGDMAPPAAALHVLALDSPDKHWVQFSPDNRLLAYGPETADKGIVCELATGKLLASNIVPRCVAFSPDGELIAIVVRTPVHQKLRTCPTAELSDKFLASERSIFLAAADTPIAGLALSSDKQLVFMGLARSPGLRAFRLGPEPRKIAPAREFGTTLAAVDWIGVEQEQLALRAPSGQIEIISTRDASARTASRPDPRLGGPAYPGPAALITGYQGGIDLVTCGKGKYAATRLAGLINTTMSKTLGLDVSAAPVAINATGTHVAFSLGDKLFAFRPVSRPPTPPAPLFVWPSGEFRYAALSKDAQLLAAEGPAGTLVVWRLAAWTGKAPWRMPTPIEWVAHFPASIRPVDLASNSPSPSPSPVDVPRPATVPMPQAKPATDEEAARAAIAVLKSHGFELDDNPQLVNVVTAQDKRAEPADAALLHALPRLVSLGFRKCPNAAEFLAACTRLPKIEQLNLDGSPIADADLAILEKFPALMSLHLRETQVQGAGLANLKHCPQLMNLTLPDKMSSGGLVHLAELTQLKSILGIPRTTTDAELKSFGKLTALEMLQLSDTKIDGSGLAHLGQHPALRQLFLPNTLRKENLPHLAKLDIEMFTFPDDTGDADLVHCEKMTRLATLRPPKNMTDEGMKTVARLPGLQQLLMHGCSRLTDEGFAPLAAAPNLQTVYLPQHIGDGALPHLARCKSLRGLSLDSHEFSDGGLAALADSGLSSLTLGAVFTDNCLDHVVKMRKLEGLGLSRAKITPQGLARVRGLANLKSLNLVYMKIGDAELAELKKMTQLESMMIQQSNVSEQQRQELTTALPKCRFSIF